ncbi:hypothetical protein [Maribellus sp. YY47]|uniref:hypothetical protein n=1 Tax=Maribellus sp. YY47 TaxID=2929486 RepID=UPI0020014F66|nr:hypothetical protein [Maribellus sp. YY47]MCK3685501.1 hypothetical protein [Maribellus sp. YY47]
MKKYYFPKWSYAVAFMWLLLLTSGMCWGQTPQYLMVSNIIFPIDANGVYVKQSGTTGLNPNWEYWKHETANYYIYADEYDGAYWWNIDDNISDNDGVYFFNDESSSIDFFTQRTSPHLVTSWAAEQGTHNPPVSLVQVVIYTPSVPTVTTFSATSITATSATLGGDITADGGADVSERGVTYASTDATPAIGESGVTKVAYSTGGTGSFSQTVSSLLPGTTYYFRAYAINYAGTSYGSVNSFTTLPQAATVTTQAVSGISTTTATGNGNITSLGVPSPTAHGVCWNTSGTPTTGDGAVDNGAASSTGAFTAPMTSLTPNTLYYVRAYATNSAGTVYGDEVSFITSPQAATVSTQAVLSIGITSAIGNGTITNLGNPDPTAIGMCWNTTGTPTISDSKTNEGAATTTGSFSSTISGLISNTQYYLRAYATNPAGTSYGDEVTFTTSSAELTWDGSEGTDWHTAGNWDGNIVPTSDYNVTIPAGLTNYPTLSSSGVCNDLTIQSSSSSTGSLLGQENLTVNGTVTVEQYLTGNAWHLVSSPAPGGEIFSFLLSNANIPANGDSRGMMDYDEPSNDWNEFFTDAEGGSLTAGKGFSLRTNADGVVRYTGTLASGTVSPTVSRTGNYGWNCVGNPFPSAIFINENADATNNFITVNTSNLDPSYAVVYVWEDGNDAYTIVGKSDAAYYAQSGQAFMVKANTDVTSLDFTQAMQTAQPSLGIKSGNSAWSGVELTARQEDKSRVAKIRFNNGMTNGLDVGYDAGVFKTGFDIYTRLLEDNGVDFGLQCLPETGMEEVEIQVGIDAATSGEISLSLKSENLPSGVVAVLNDKATGMSFPFNREEAVYTTTIDGAQGYGRFTLTFSSTTAVDDMLSGEPHFKAWYSSGSIYISGELDGTGEATVYDINGRKLAIHKLSSGVRNRIAAPAGANSLYLVRISDSKRNEVLKVPVTGR